MFKPQFSLIKNLKPLHNEEVSKSNYVSEQPKLLKSFDNI